MTQGKHDIKCKESRKESNGNILSSYHLNQLNWILLCDISESNNEIE